MIQIQTMRSREETGTLQTMSDGKQVFVAGKAPHQLFIPTEGTYGEICQHFERVRSLPGDANLTIEWSPFEGEMRLRLGPTRVNLAFQLPSGEPWDVQLTHDSPLTSLIVW